MRVCGDAQAHHCPETRCRSRANVRQKWQLAAGAQCVVSLSMYCIFVARPQPHALLAAQISTVSAAAGASMPGM